MAIKIVRTRSIHALLNSSVSTWLTQKTSQKTQLTNFAKYSNNVNTCKFSVSAVVSGSAGHAETTSTTQGLSKLQAQELILRLNGEERNILMTALHEYQSKLVKDEYEGQLAASRWRSKFGRPSKLPRLGDVDPTGTFCTFPEDWLKKKMAYTYSFYLTWRLRLGTAVSATLFSVSVSLVRSIAHIIIFALYAEVASIPRPTTRNLVDIGIANSIPFIGFGFLDNFFMLIFGDYIDLYLGSYFCLTTMGAAALGNTISDILGIGSAFYVERLANRIGFSPPKLSPMQLDMTCSRNAANAGRVLGVTLGCILGMCPLLWRKKKEEIDDDLEMNILANS